MSRNIISLPRVSMATGAVLAGIGAYVATSHIDDIGLKWLVWGIAGGSVIAVAVMSSATSKWAATLAVVAIVAAELFGVVNQAERLLAERAMKSGEAERFNRTRAIAVANEKAAREAVITAKAAETAERAKGGCKNVCRDMERATAAAHIELEAAQAALKNAPAEATASHLANATGLPRWLVDLVPALLASAAVNGLAFALLAMGHGAPPLEPKAAQPPIPETRIDESERVISWVREFRRRHGRDPQIPELQTAFTLPKTTAWRRIKSA